MKKVYSLEGVDCVDCAAKLEKKLNTVDNVISVKYNFLTEKCIFEADEENMDSVIAKAEEIIKLMEPEARFYKK